MATQAEVRNRALRLIQVTDAYNPPNANIAAEADNFLTDLHEEMVDRRLVDWELTAIPARATRALVYMLGHALLDVHDVDPDIYQKVTVGAQEAQKRLYEQASVPYNGEPVQADYF
ncbi:MAG: hypothetical protein ACPGSM_18645 [Thiolinea sp.]